MATKKSTSTVEMKNKVAYGIFPSRAGAERAVDLLKSSNFRSADISALLPTPDSSKEFAHTNTTKSPEGAMVGAGSGATIGGVLGWLAGIGSIAIPGLGPFVAAGPLMGLLAGAGTGSILGGLTGALIGLGIPEYEARRFEGRIKEGGILVSVHADNDEWLDRARDILEQAGAEDISTSDEESGDYDDKTRPHVHNY